MSLKISDYEYSPQQNTQSTNNTPKNTNNKAIIPSVYSQSLSASAKKTANNVVQISTSSQPIAKLSKEEQAIINKKLNESYAKLEEEYKNTKSHKGLIGGAWDGIKNLTGMKTGSKNVDKELEQLKKDIDAIAKNPDKASELYEKITGSKLTSTEITKLKNGEDVLAESKRGMAVSKYTTSQKSASNLVADVASGIVAGAVFTAAVAAAPFSGGASIAVGILAASAAGAAVKVGVKALDKTIGGDKYTWKDAKYDVATGALNGVLAPITAGVGGAVAKGLGGTLAKEAGEEIIEAGAKQVIKEAGKQILIGAAKGAAQGAINGSVGNTVGYLASTDKDKITLKDAGKAFAGGLVGGALTGGVMGGSTEAVKIGFGALSANLATKSLIPELEPEVNITNKGVTNYSDPATVNFIKESLDSGLLEDEGLLNFVKEGVLTPDDLVKLVAENPNKISRGSYKALIEAKIPLTEFDNAEILEARLLKLTTKPVSMDNPEIQIAKQNILDDVNTQLEQVSKDGKAIIITGYPGSGKTYCLSKLEEMGLVENGFTDSAFKPDADQMKALLPGYDGGRGAGVVHNASVEIVGDAIATAREVKANMVVQTTGWPEHVETLAQNFKDAGYNEVIHVHVNVSEDTAMSGAVSRLLKEGRFMDPLDILQSSQWNNNVQLRDIPAYFKDSGLFNNSICLDNNVRGRLPLIEAIGNYKSNPFQE